MSSGRSRPSSKSRCCCSPAARIRSSCCTSPARRSGRATVPFPVMHVDTGHNFPEVIAFRDRHVPGDVLVASVQESIDHGRVADEPSRNGLQTDDAARRDRRARLRRGVRRRAPRRGARAGEGAGLLVPRRLRAVGPAAPAAGAVGHLQRPRAQGRARARVPALELDRARRVGVHPRRGSRAAADLLRPRARGVRARRDAVRGLRLPRRKTTASRRSRRPCAIARSAT